MIPENAANPPYPREPAKARFVFAEAQQLFESGDDYLEIFDAEHSELEDRFIGIGPIDRGIIVVSTRTRRGSHPDHRHSNGQQARAVLVPLAHGSNQMTDIPELTTNNSRQQSLPASASG